MKKVLFSLIASSAFMLAACGDDSSSASTSLAELCTVPKVTAECLEGEWTLSKFVDEDGVDLSTYVSDAVGRNGGSLVFTLDATEGNSFEYTSGGDAGQNFGLWTLANDSTFGQVNYTVGNLYGYATTSVHAEMLDTNTLVISKSAFELLSSTLATNGIKEYFVRK